jgi:hypothetical protein
MAKAERLELIKTLQQKRGSHVICYLTSSRAGLEIQMAMDSIFKIHEHLRAFPKPRENRKVDFFLFSNGGDGTVPWRLVTLIREFCDEFNVLVPYRAFSAATLTAMGADHIVMHPMGMLGPTDATVSNGFNPKGPNNQPIGISVEDVSAYLALIKEDAEIRHEDEVVLAFNKLAEQVHPLALGNVKRHISQSRMMARKLLCLHMDEAKTPQQIDEIVENLTSKSYYHGHPINRDEAKKHFGLTTIADPTSEEEELMWSLYLEYEKELLNETPFRPMDEFIKAFPNATVGKTEITPVSIAKLAYIESVAKTDVSSFDYQISGAKQPSGGTKIELLTLRQGWITE